MLSVSAMDHFPFIEVFSHETGLPVQVVVWHVRSIRPIREAAVDDDTVTRIEFSSGDPLDVTDSVDSVRVAIESACAPLAEIVRHAIQRLE